MKWAYFVNLSTTTRMTFFPFDFGKPLIKSMLMKVQTMVGIGRGARRLG
jgi:hypothetical protein